MAEDKLIFRIGFDLETGVKEAMKDGDLALGRIEKALVKNPIIIKMRLDQQERLSGQVKSESRKAASALSGLKKEMADLNRQWNTLTASERGGEAGAKLMAQYRALSEEAKGYMTTLNAAVKLEDKLARQREKSANAAAKAAQKTREYTDELKSHDGYVSRLIKRLAVYASFQMASNFLTSVRDVTAEFELQRVSLGAIIQDQQKANQIFAEIKSFALTSPLKILDLTKYAKQVAAYGFETDRIFDVTKRLADISVGLGVDMGRLSLAVSQIKAATILKSSELRQLTETGLPMLDLLAKKLTETQGKIVSTAEVMDLISKRAISYEMVEEILYDLTDAGGMFYNMQVKQSQTLYGMWSKLGDAAAIMYDQIGNTSSVNEGMKAAIYVLEFMMRNWKTTATWVGALTAGIATYTLVLKNAAVASKALTAIEGVALLAAKARTIATPKLVAAIIGQNAATKLSTSLTQAHTVAMMRQAVATNVLSRAFWGLTAAMLANPWALVAGIAVFAGYAIYKFASATETAAERAEQLNNSVASLKNLETTTGGLVETYNELSAKTERTAEEQKKLSEVTHELAKQYPGAITAIGNFGEEVELAADKLNKLYQAEKQARMDNARDELDKTKKSISETKEEIAKLQEALQIGTKTIAVGSSNTGYVQTVTVQMSDEDKGKLVGQITELRNNLTELEDVAEAAEAAMKGITVEQLQIEKFGAWKKTLTTFKEQVGNIQVRLFEDSTINQFSSLQEALKKTAEEYKRNIALVATYDETLKSTTLTSEERAKIETERAEADAMANLAEKALKYYNAMSLLDTTTSSRGTKSDNRLQSLQEIERTLTSINKKYEELAKTEGSAKALEYVRKNYASTLEYINKLGKQFKLNFAMPTDFKDLQSYRKAIQGVIEQLKMKGHEKAAIELELKIAEGNQAQLQKDIQAKLKAIADEISRTKTAREFYEKILGQTGDVDMAINLTTSIFGENGKDLKGQIVNQITTALADTKVELPVWIIDAENNIDYKALRKFAEKAKETKAIGENVANELIKIADNGEKELSRIAQEGAKLLLKYDEIAQQRVNIEQEASNQIKTLREAEALYLASNATEAEKKAYSKRTNKAVAGVEADRDLKLLKLQDEYLRFFSAIHSLTNKEAEALRTKVREALFKAFQSGAISADELKRELKAVDEQFQKLIDDSGFAMDYLKGGFDGLIQRLRDTADEVQSVAAEISKMESPDQISEGQKSFIDKILGKFGDKTTGSNFAGLFSKTNGNLKEMGGLLGKVSGKMGGMAQGAAKALAIVDRIITDVARTIEGVAAIRDQLNSMRSEDNQLEGGFWDAFEYLENFNKYAAQGWENLKSGNIVGAVQNTVQSIISIFGTAQAQRVRKANKEIKRQAELLEQLEYTYGRLQNAADKLFGADYLQNYNQQIKNLEAQQQAYLKQAQAERSKGKKADKEKIKEYENQARETADKIKELQGDLVAHFTGADQASAARDFVQSWLEAKVAFANTADAIKSKYKDLIKNMIIEGAAAKVIDNVLGPLYEEFGKRLKENPNDPYQAIDYFVNAMDTSIEQMDNGLEVLWKALEARGYDMKEMLGDVDSNYTGIAKDVANATSEEVNANTLALTTQTHYLALVNENVLAIRMRLEGGQTTTAIPEAATAGWTDWQQQAMENYNAIARNTAQTVAECKRAADACTAATEKLNRIVRTKGSITGIDVWLHS